MAKTKRRSCKGGRRSRRRSGGGPHENYRNRFKVTYHAGPKAHGFGEHPQVVSRFGDTRQSVTPRPSISPPLSRIEKAERILAAMKDRIVYNPTVRKLGASVGRTASAARGLGASAMSKIGLNRSN